MLIHSKSSRECGADVLVWLVSLSLLTSLHAFAAEPPDTRRPLSPWLDACLAQKRSSIEQVVSLELNRPVSPALDPPGASAERVTIACSAAVLSLRYVSDSTQRKRSLDVRSISDKALARTVALAVVELIEAPVSPKPGTADPLSPTVRPEVPTPPARATTAARASLRGTARSFVRPPTSPWVCGCARASCSPAQRPAVRIRRRKRQGRSPAGQRVGYCGVRGAGFGYDVWRPGLFTLALEALGEAGYVVPNGQPRVVANTDGEQLRGAWNDLQFSVAPRFRFAAGLDLTSRAGIGIMLLTPSATFDSNQLDVRHGVSAILGRIVGVKRTRISNGEY